MRIGRRWDAFCRIAGQQDNLVHGSESDLLAQGGWDGRLQEKGDSLMIQVSGKSGEPLVVECRGKKVVSEVMLEKAEKHPLNKEVLAGQLGRLGGTEFQLGLVRNLLQGEVMIPLGELNRVRRRLVEELKEEAVVKDGRAILARLMPQRGVVDEGLPELRVLCRSLEQVVVCARAGVGFVYCDFEDLKDSRPTSSPSPELRPPH